MYFLGNSANSISCTASPRSYFPSCSHKTGTNQLFYNFRTSMNCSFCNFSDDRPFREKYHVSKPIRRPSPPPSPSSSSESQPPKKSASLGIKLLNALGLREFILNKFVFRPVPASTLLFNQPHRILISQLTSAPQPRQLNLPDH
jgi:hypothetical protein